MHTDRPCQRIVPCLLGLLCRHVIIASMAGVVPSAGQAVYSAAKTGLKAYFLSVASELADK